MPQTIPLALAVAEKAFREFHSQWLSGLQPILSLETAPDGQIHVLFKVVAGAGDASGQHEVALHRCGVDEQARCRQHWRRSPSYRRRLLKRAAARAAADDTVMKRTTDVKFVQTEAEKLSGTTPYPDQVLPCVLAVEAEEQPQYHPQQLPQDEVCSDDTWAESLPLSCQTTLPQLDGQNDSDVLNRSEINVTEFLNIIKNQESDRRIDAENAREEREAEREEDIRKFRRLLNLPPQ